MKFSDPVNPTDAELRQWASRGDTPQPVQDFDLMVAVPDKQRLALLIEMVVEPTCRERRFFLRCLYLLVGDAVRSQFQSIPRHFVDELITSCEKAESPLLLELAQNARALLNAPETFDYQDWCDGRLARQSLKRNKPLNSKGSRPSS